MCHFHFWHNCHGQRTTGHRATSYTPSATRRVRDGGYITENCTTGWTSPTRMDMIADHQVQVLHHSVPDMAGTLTWSQCMENMRRHDTLYVPLTYVEYNHLMDTGVIDPSDRIKKGWTHAELLSTAQDLLSTAAFLQSHSYVDCVHNGQEIYMVSLRLHLLSTADRLMSALELNTPERSTLQAERRPGRLLPSIQLGQWTHDCPTICSTFAWCDPQSDYR